MSNAFTFNITNNIGMVEFNLEGEKVNKLTANVLNELNDLLDRLASEKNIQALGIKSTKKGTFIAGADIGEIAQITDPKDGQEKAEKGQLILDKIAQLPFPTLAIIDGACLGGGLELALACDFRVCSDHVKTKLGLPEVNLGIIPGFGGTQRLPRLIGLQAALKIILSGKPVDAKKALRGHLVDAMFPHAFMNEKSDDFLAQICSPSYREKIIKKRNPQPTKRYITEKNMISRSVTFNAVRENVLKRTKGHYPAPLKAIEVIKRTYQKTTISAGLKIESTVFGELSANSTCKNLVRLFYMQEHVKKNGTIPGYPEKRDIKHVAVLGAGVMGGGISWTLTNAGIRTRMKDLEWSAIAKGYESTAKIYGQLKKIRKLDSREINLRMHHLTGSTDYRGFQKMDVVIEAIVEDLAIKRSVLAELEENISDTTIIASNTSTLPITDMAVNLKHPERFIGMHFFNPVNRMPLVEVIPGKDTAPETINAIVSLAKQLKKMPIVVKSCPGFLVNRLLLPYLNEAVFLLESGESPQRIDKLLTRFGMPMGPLTLIDEVGIDVCYKAAKILETAYGTRMAMARFFSVLYKEHGLLGKKSGEGIYLHRGNHREVNPKVLTYIHDFRSEMTDQGSNLTDQEIVDRTMLTMVNEAARSMGEEIVESPQDLDMAMIMGTGFPPFKGGLLRYADSLGTTEVNSRLKQFEAQWGERFSPAEYLSDLAAKNTSFYHN